MKRNKAILASASILFTLLAGCSPASLPSAELTVQDYEKINRSPVLDEQAIKQFQYDLYECGTDNEFCQGKVMYIGFSEWNATQIADAIKIQDAKGFNRFVSSQPQYSALWRVIESQVDPLCRAEGIGHIVWSPIAQGVLSGKYLPGKKPPTGSRATDKKSGAAMISRWMNDDILREVAKLEPIARDCGLTMAQLAIAWVLQNKNVSSAIIGASKAKQVKENVKAAGVKLSDDVMRAIDNAIGAIAERDPAKDVSPNPRP